MNGFSIINQIIVGRIEPHIYAFTTNTIPNYLKVGDTYRPVNVRLDEWRNYFPNLKHESDWEWLAKTENGKYFRDFAIHYYLEVIKRYHRLQPTDFDSLPYYSREFFENATPKDIDESLRCAARLLGYALDLALHPGLRVEDVAALLE